MDYGFPSAGPCRYFPAAHESRRQTLGVGIATAIQRWGGLDGTVVAEGLRCCGRACCNGKYKEPPDLPGGRRLSGAGAVVPDAARGLLRGVVNSRNAGGCLLCFATVVLDSSSLRWRGGRVVGRPLSGARL